MNPLLLWYRVLAYVVGTLLVLLVFVGIPLQLWAHNDTVVFIVGAAHGWLFIAYLVVTLTLAYRHRFSLLRIALTLVAGLVPIATFVAERKNTAHVTALLRDAEPAVAPTRPYA